MSIFVGLSVKTHVFTDKHVNLANELYRLFDERVHVAVVVDEWNHLAVFCEDLLDLP